MKLGPAFCLMVIYSSAVKTEEIVYNNSDKLSSKLQILDHNLFINKVSLTQNGYSQFLKYTTDVLQMSGYTFCIWLRSNNLTHNHPILSYSKTKDERLIRVWIGPYGKNIFLEIDSNMIFDASINIIENRWYHICQSWSSSSAIWVLYLNGKIKSTGSHSKLRGYFIKGGGDIIVGQEYTDSHKGYGIEGDITGFNFVLSATTDHRKHFQKVPSRRKYYEPGKKNTKLPVHFHKAGSQFATIKSAELGNYKTLSHKIVNAKTEYTGEAVVDSKRDPKNVLDIFRSIFAEHHPPKVRIVQKYKPLKATDSIDRSTDRFAQNKLGKVRKSLGLLLVELSFDCGYQKGAPLSGEGVLINWTKSPVRVFGGAVLKVIPAFCYGNIEESYSEELNADAQ